MEGGTSRDLIGRRLRGGASCFVLRDMVAHEWQHSSRQLLLAGRAGDEVAPDDYRAAHPHQLPAYRPLTLTLSHVDNISPSRCSAPSRSPSALPPQPQASVNAVDSVGKLFAHCPASRQPSNPHAHLRPHCFAPCLTLPASSSPSLPPGRCFYLAHTFSPACPSLVPPAHHCFTQPSPTDIPGRLPSSYIHWLVDHLRSLPVPPSRHGRPQPKEVHADQTGKDRGYTILFY